MSFCKNCGSSLEAKAAFCPYCGKAVGRVFEPAPQVIPGAGCQPPVVYDSVAFEFAKEYVSAVRPARNLSIAALVMILSIIPAGVLLILIPFSTLLLAGMGIASLVCAIVSSVKLGRIKDIPVVYNGSIDPVSFGTYSKAVGNAKSAKVMNIIVIVIAVLAVLAVLVLALFFGSILGMLYDSSTFSGPAYYY